MTVRISAIGMAPDKKWLLNEYSPYSTKNEIHIGESTHLQYITGLLICFQIYSRTDIGKLRKKNRKVNFDIMLLQYYLSLSIRGPPGM